MSDPLFGPPPESSTGAAANGRQLEDVACLACGSSDRTPWATEAGFTAWRCSQCRLVYVSPRPVAEARSEASRTGSHEREDGTLEVTGAYSRPREVSLLLRLARLYGLRSLRSTPRRWLDVGCGHGELLVALGRLLPEGSTIVGVEPNDAKRANAVARGLDVRCSIDDVDGEFDVLSLMNVYSHLPDPVGALGELASRLGSTGELLLETGNAADLVDRAAYPGSLDLPDHLSFVGESQLTSILGSIGFDVVRLDRVRLDGIVGTAWEIVRGGGGSSRWRLPFRSSFRDLYVRARRPGGEHSPEGSIAAR
jgi:SAM-dependent methyltransferase